MCNTVDEWGMIVLYRSYLVLDALVLVCVLLLAWGVNGALTSSFYVIPFVSPTSWNFQFWLFTLSLIALPLVLGSMLLFYSCQPAASRDLQHHCNVTLFQMLYNRKFRVIGIPNREAHRDIHMSAY
jgi:hypothetical protein